MESDEIIIITAGSMVVRCPVNQIRTAGRNTQGVRLIKLNPKDEVASAMKVVAREESGTETGSEEEKK